MQEVNCVELKGTIRSELKYDHQDYYGTKFYYTKLVAKRLSGFEDTIPILISDDLLESKEIKIEELTGKYVRCTGKFKSINILDVYGKIKHVRMVVLVENIESYENEGDEIDINEIFLDGYICKNSIYKITRKQNRKISAILLAVNYPDGKSDYIWCIAWNRNAKILKDIEVGSHLKCLGRIQERKVFCRKMKTIKFVRKNEEEPEIGEWQQVYEVSIGKMELLEE